MMLLVAHPSSHSVAIIVNTARHQNQDFVFNHWVCFCISHVRGVIQPVKYYDSHDKLDHNCKQIAHLLFGYASQNFAGFASAAPVNLSPLDMDALLPVQVPPTSSDSMSLGAYADTLQCLRIPPRPIGIGGLDGFSLEDP